MSYNIDHTTILKLDASIEAAKLLDLIKRHGDAALPVCAWPDDHLSAATALLAERASPAMVRLRSFHWSGIGSGASFEDVLVKEFAPHVVGTVEVVFTWEGGDNHSGLRIVDGKVTQPKVKLVLEEE